MKKHDPKAHFEPVKRDNGASAYCLKEETRVEGPWSFGTKPVDRASATDWQKIKDAAKAGQLEEIPPDIYVRCYNSLKRIEKDHQQIPYRSEPKVSLVLGSPRTGKTRKAHTDNQGAYIKLANKWWDGY